MNRVVVYTVILGDYDNLMEPRIVSSNCDYVCLTNKRGLKSRVWQVKRIEPIFKHDIARSSREPKILAHKYFKNYNYSLYVDGNIEVIGDPSSMVNRYLVDSDMAVFSHNQLVYSPGQGKLQKMINTITLNLLNEERYNCVYEEVKHLKKLYLKGKKKDNLDVVEKQVAGYRNSGYPANNGLIAGGVLLRRHNKLEVINTMEAWWREVRNGSKRDQLSFNYVAWKNNFKFSYIRGDIRKNKYFQWHNHKSMNYSYRD